MSSPASRVAEVVVAEVVAAVSAAAGGVTDGVVAASAAVAAPAAAPAERPASTEAPRAASPAALPDALVTAVSVRPARSAVRPSLKCASSAAIAGFYRCGGPGGGLGGREAGRRRRRAARRRGPHAAGGRGRAPEGGAWRGACPGTDSPFLRAGRAASKTDLDLRTAFRAQVCSGSTSTLPPTVGRQPSSLAMSRASRRLRSIVERRSCRSGSLVLHSKQRIACSPGRQARTSTDPRSPQTLNVCSGLAVQPARRSFSTTDRTRRACDSSSSFAISTPRHRAVTATEIPNTDATLRSVRTVVSSAPPRSMSDTMGRLTRAAEAISAWVRPRRSLTARIALPNWASSTA